MAEADPTTPIAVRNPRTGENDYAITPPPAAALNARCRELKANQRTWAARPLAERVAVLQAWRQSLATHQPALAEALMADTGRRAISYIEASSVAGLIDRWCTSAPQLIEAAQAGSHPTVHPTISYRTQLVPVGLVGNISPWNFPLTLSLIDTVPALLAGCAVAIKPSEVTPRFAAPLKASIDAVPDLRNVLDIFTGAGATGQQLIDAVDAVCFTGSVATGRKVGVQAARNFIPAFLELGGKDPAIVLPSADPETAAQVILRASIVNAGQACQSLERVYVHEAIAQPFIDALVAAANAVTLNADDVHKGHIGPVIFARQGEIIQHQIDDAVARGAKVLTGGKVETIGGGTYCRPTVLINVTHDMAVIREETFGPVIPVMVFSDIDDAVRLANDSDYGLSAAVFAATAQEAEAVGSQLMVGAVSINDGSLTGMVWEAEKNSFRLSGLGASRMGASGLMRFFRKRALLRQSGAAATIDAYAEDRMP